MYKIMFIDDDSLILRRLHQILNWKELGFEILPDATDGIAALKQIKELPPDVIVCDINMPEIDTGGAGQKDISGHTIYPLDGKRQFWLRTAGIKSGSGSLFIKTD